MADWYINADTGNDTTGDGSSGNPWLTISKAHTSASGGDTIIVMASVNTYIFAGTQTFIKSLTIRGEDENPENQVFDGGGATSMWKADTNTNLSFAISNLTFQNGVASGDGFWTPQAAATNCNSTWTNCIFRDYRLNGQTLSNGDYTFFFSRAGVTLATRGTLTITGCIFDTIYGTAGRYTSIFGYATSGHQTATVTNCSFFFSSSFEKISSFEVVNTGGVVTNVYKNCIIYAGVSTPFKTGVGTTTSTFNYSDAYQITSPPAGTGNITSDPLFVDQDNGNFNLRPASPCLYTGTLI